MQSHLRRSVLVLFCIIGLNTIVNSQTLYKVKATPDIDIRLLGTSTLHDWEMDAVLTTGEAQFIINPKSENELVSINSLSFSLLVNDLKSDNDGLNKNAYKALKSDKYKDIRYHLTFSTLSPEKGGYLIKSKGDLTIAGVTRVIYMDVHCVLNDNGTITYKGSYNLRMTDYDVQPPSFMWGAMTTGDAVTLNFVVVYEK